MRKKSCNVILATTFVFGLSSALSQTAGIDGAWELNRYCTNEDCMKASGLLVLNDGRFAMIYTMNSGAEKLSARSHAGSYRIDNDRLTFDVKYWVENVDDAPRIVPGAIVKPRMDLDDDELILNFESGSVQGFQRLTSPDESINAGTWELQSVGSDNPGNSNKANGLMVIADNHFAFAYVSKDEKSGAASGGTGASVGASGNLVKHWNVEVIDGMGSASTGDNLQKFVLHDSGSLLVLRGSDGTHLNFSQEANRN